MQVKMKRKNESQAQSGAKRKWNAQKEVSKNWPPFPLQEDGCYPGSKDPERIWCAFRALNWLIDVAIHQEEIERGAKGLWYSDLYREQYLSALEEAANIKRTWTGLLNINKLQTVPVADNTCRLKKEDFSNLRQWFQTVGDLVSGDIEEHEKQAIAIAEKDIQESEIQENGRADTTPDDLIDLCKAVELYHRSRAQLKRDIENNLIHDYRKIKNGKHWISKKEADNLYISK